MVNEKDFFEDQAARSAELNKIQFIADRRATHVMCVFLGFVAGFPVGFGWLSVFGAVLLVLMLAIAVILADANNISGGVFFSSGYMFAMNTLKGIFTGMSGVSAESVQMSQQSKVPPPRVSQDGKVFTIHRDLDSPDDGGSNGKAS